MFSFILSGLLVGAAGAQTTLPLSLAITLHNPVVERGHVPIVHLKIKWGSVPDAKPETLRACGLRWSSLVLIRTDVRRGLHRRDLLAAA